MYLKYSVRLCFSMLIRVRSTNRAFRAGMACSKMIKASVIRLTRVSPLFVTAIRLLVRPDTPKQVAFTDGCATGHNAWVRTPEIERNS